MYGGGVMLGWRAGSDVGKYNAESPKQGSKMFNSIIKTIHFAQPGILFIYDDSAVCTVKVNMQVPHLGGKMLRIYRNNR